MLDAVLEISLPAFNRISGGIFARSEPTVSARF
jgi:hypothetical protein